MKFTNFLWALIISLGGFNLLKATPYAEDIKLLPNWSQISLDDLEAFTEPGFIGNEYDSVAGYEVSRSWQAGELPEEVIKLGDLESSFAPQSLSLEQIGQLSGNHNLERILLSDFPLVGNQTLRELIAAVPQLGNKTLAQVPIIKDLISQQGYYEASQFNSRSLSSLAKSHFGQLKLNNLDLSQYSFSHIPNLEQSQLQDFAGYKDSSVSEIPGLSEVPLSDYPNSSSIAAVGSVIARIDFVWGSAESDRNRTITGSYVEGFNVKCDSDCSYLELDDIENVGATVQLPFEGQQWIVGKNHWVAGGTGCLSGGREPTGRHPFGPTFKSVLWSTDETTDSATFMMFFNFKVPCGESAYFIGPIPFPLGWVNINDWIFVGV